VADIHDLLAADHARLDALLAAALARPGEVERPAYDAFRAGLLRHIAMEEKILLPAARAARGEPLPLAAALRRDHAALASLLVPPPTPEVALAIRDLLDRHNPLEEGEGGVYRACDDLLAAERDEIVHRLRAAPPVALAPYLDNPRVRAHIRSLLAASRGSGPGR
jgi:hypothetical protein